jgi:hypothetical protein
MNADLIREQLDFLQAQPNLSPAQQEWCAWATERLGEPTAPAAPAPQPAPLDIDTWARQQADAWDKDALQDAGPEHFLSWMVVWLWLHTDDCRVISGAIRRARPFAFARSYHLLREVRQIASRGIENGILRLDKGVQTDWFNIEDPARQTLSVILDLMTLAGTLKRGDYTPEQGYEYALANHNLKNDEENLA